MRKAILYLLILGCGVLPLVLVVSRSIRDKWASEADTKDDLITVAQFLGFYAADHAGRLPDSWSQLVASGFVADDPRGGCRFLKYNTNRLHDPLRIRWVAGALLDDYELRSDGFFNKRRNSSARILWVEDVPVPTVDQLYCTKLLFDVYQYESGEGSKAQSQPAPP